MLKRLVTIFILSMFSLMPLSLFAANSLFSEAASDGELKNLSADKWKFVANNIILEGNVIAVTKNLNINADKIVINLLNNSK